MRVSGTRVVRWSWDRFSVQAISYGTVDYEEMLNAQHSGRAHGSCVASCRFTSACLGPPAGESARHLAVLLSPLYYRILQMRLVAASRFSITRR